MGGGEEDRVAINGLCNLRFIPLTNNITKHTLVW